MRADPHLRQLTDALKETLTKCAHDPDVDAVHDTRTGTRRIEATLEAKLRNIDVQRADESDPLAKAARDWERLLKRVRRAAAPVRDLDVHRKLLKKLVPSSKEGLEQAQNGVEDARASQAKRLDDALQAEREKHAVPLKKSAAKWAEKQEEHFSDFTAALEQKPALRARKPDAAAMALDAFARLSTQMLQLDAGNLHDFRKGAKKARYMAEAGGEDEYAGAVGKALKKLQDEIGDWHDWLVLAEEARDVLGDDGMQLTAEIERKRDLRFAAAMKLATGMRGKLMGEWLGTCRPVTRAPYSDKQRPLVGDAGSRRRERARVAAPDGRAPASSSGVAKSTDAPGNP